MSANTRAACHTSHTHKHTHVRKPEKLLNCFIKCTNSQLIVSVEKRVRGRERSDVRNEAISKTVCSLRSTLFSLPGSCSCNFNFNVFVSISISISSRSAASGYMLYANANKDLYICIIYAWAYWQLLLRHLHKFHMQHCSCNVLQWATSLTLRMLLELAPK